MHQLREIFLDLCHHPLSVKLWDDIEREYSGSERHYHNLHHLSNMYEQLLLSRHLIQDWHSVLFALFYHDYVYQSTARDNEEQSAGKATDSMIQLAIDQSRIDAVVELILATKHHAVNDKEDVNLFTDADLSILGSSWEMYDEYAKQVRREYSIYPDIVYKPGRKKVLNHFLEMPAIFKTDFFRDRHEATARENLKRELAQL